MLELSNQTGGGNGTTVSVMAAGAPANVNANAGYYTVFDANALAAKDGVIVKAGPPTGSELDYPALFLSSLAEVVACTVVGHFSLLILIIGFSDYTARCIVSCGPSFTFGWYSAFISCHPITLKRVVVSLVERMQTFPCLRFCSHLLIFSSFRSLLVPVVVVGICEQYFFFLQAHRITKIGRLAKGLPVG